MGLFGKIKNIFYDEEIIEVPEETVKKEERPKIEEVKSIRREEVISRPKEEVKPVTPIYTERELFKTQPVNTFKFPMVDEEDEIKPTRTSRSMSYEEPKRREKRHLEKTSMLIYLKIRLILKNLKRNQKEFLNLAQL